VRMTAFYELRSFLEIYIHYELLQREIRVEPGAVRPHSK